MGYARQKITRTVVVTRNKVNKTAKSSKKTSAKSKRCPSCGRYM